MDLRERIAEYPDFPKKGVLFRDFAPLLADARAVEFAADELLRHFDPRSIDIVAGIESRGFVVAAALAARCGRGMLMIRKAGKLPGRTISASYEIEYGSDTMEMQEGSLSEGQRVLICDDLLATGGTAEAAAHLVERAGGSVAGLAFVIELADLGGAKRIQKYDSKALVTY